MSIERADDRSGDRSRDRSTDRSRERLRAASLRQRRHHCTQIGPAHESSEDGATGTDIQPPAHTVSTTYG
jgi:hypothetical protein